MSTPNKSRQRSDSHLAQALHFSDDASDLEDYRKLIPHLVESRSHNNIKPRAESSPSRLSFNSSLNQKTPARSYFQRTVHSSLAPIDATNNAANGVREDTAELASWALSDAASIRSGTPPHHHAFAAENTSPANQDSYFDGLLEQTFPPEACDSGYPDAIEEVSEPVSPERGLSPPKTSCTASTLTQMINNASCALDDCDEEEDAYTGNSRIHRYPANVRPGTLSQPHEGTALLYSKSVLNACKRPTYTVPPDLEAFKCDPADRLPNIRKAKTMTKDWSIDLNHTLLNSKKWDKRLLWENAVLKPAGYVPAILLGLLLNILDALSYGMILFPLGQPIFASLGPDGISMFYVSCIVSQLVYSLGGSIFKGGIGSEMIEVVPFFHKMAFTILAQVGEENPKSVLATTILSYSMSSVLTGVVFYVMGRCRLGFLIGFFPRHILIGCIGGVGWFLIATAVEVSARLDGNLEYNLSTLKKLTQADTVALWTIPLALALILLTIKRWVTHSLTDAAYFLSIMAIFYFFVAAIPDLDLIGLRSKGWVFEAPEAGVPFYHFYTLYDFEAVNWKALGSTVPAMFALTFFGVLHVPINIPALGLTTGEDNVDVDRELRAHGWSNALSGLCGSIQNYLVYTNTVLFMRSGGDSRAAGVLLAFATFGVLVIGPVLIGFIPIMIVGALIFFLGLELMREALVATWGKLHRLEYLTIVIIVVTMGAYDFVVGILAGIVLACVSFVVQSSQISAIRGILPTETEPRGIASSTVRRHPIHCHFLKGVGHQIYVMKLAGYLFFGTIVGVENRVRALLQDDNFHSLPIRFLVLDLSKVDGVDFSAAEAFTRINRILSVRDVQMIMSGISTNSDVWKSLFNVGLLTDNDGVKFCDNLNSALEDCENQLLKTLYRHRGLDAPLIGDSSPNFLDIPDSAKAQFSGEPAFSSPRRDQLLEVATTTLRVHEDITSNKKRRQYEQPMQLILLTFASVSDKSEDFWKHAVRFFKKKEYAGGNLLYQQGDRPNGFYLLESGMLRAEYKLPQGTFTELIVAGTTCGELPFFSNTQRTSTTSADMDSVTWVLDDGSWAIMQREQPEIAQELLKISLKFTTERMDAITKYMLTNG